MQVSVSSDYWRRQGSDTGPTFVKTFIMTTIGDEYQIAGTEGQVTDRQEEGRDKLGRLLSASYKFDT